MPSALILLRFYFVTITSKEKYQSQTSQQQENNILMNHVKKEDVATLMILHKQQCIDQIVNLLLVVLN